MMGFPKNPGAPFVRRPRFLANPISEVQNVTAHFEPHKIIAQNGSVLFWPNSAGNSIMAPIVSTDCVYEANQLRYPNLRIAGNSGWLAQGDAVHTQNTFIVTMIVTNQSYASVLDNNGTTVYHGGVNANFFHQPMTGQKLFYNGAEVALTSARPSEWTVVRIYTPSSVPIRWIGKQPNGSPRVWLGRFAEIVLVNEALPDGTVSRITRYLCAKYGITYLGA